MVLCAGRVGCVGVLFPRWCLPLLVGGCGGVVPTLGHSGRMVLTQGQTYGRMASWIGRLPTDATKRRQIMATQLETYLAGRDAFRVLSGDIDKDALKKALIDGYAAVVMLADNGKSLAEIAGMHRDLSKSKVERDVRAGRTIAALPKVDPVLIVKACNVGTAAQVKDAIASEKPAAALRDIVEGSNGERRKRAARGAADQSEKTEKGPKTEKQPKRVVTLDTLPQWIESQTLSASAIPALDAIIAACEAAKVKARNNRAA